MLPSKRNQNWLPGIINDIFGNEWMAKANASSPALNIIETEKEYKVELAAPGIEKGDFKVDLNNDGQLVVSMEKKQEKEEKNEKYLRRDFSFSQFQQTLILPDNVDKEKIEAKHENGVLTIVLHKKDAIDVAPTKRVDIK